MKLSTLKKVGVCGVCGVGPEFSGGQPVKIRIIVEELKSVFWRCSNSQYT